MCPSSATPFQPQHRRGRVQRGRTCRWWVLEVARAVLQRGHRRCGGGSRRHLTCREGGWGRSLAATTAPFIPFLPHRAPCCTSALGHQGCHLPLFQLPTATCCSALAAAAVAALQRQLHFGSWSAFCSSVSAKHQRSWPLPCGRSCYCFRRGLGSAQASQVNVNSGA